MNSTLRTSQRMRAAAVGLAATAALVALPSSASAESYEQVSRANGPQGWAPFLSQNTPEAVSDDGRLAVFASGGFQEQRVFVRDIVANTTTPLGGDNVYAVLGFDKAARQMLLLRHTGPGITFRLEVVPTNGGRATVLKTLPNGNVTGAISGDGKTVVYSDRCGGKATQVSLVTGTQTALSTGPIDCPTISPNSLSDDGKVIGVVNEQGFRGGAYISGGKLTETPGSPVVSPDGAIIAYLGYDAPSGRRTVIARRLADGATRTALFPDALRFGAIAWISPDGYRIAVSAPGTDLEGDPSQVLNVAAGTWSRFGGAYAGGINQDLLMSFQLPYASTGSVISRSGRYGLVALSDQPQADLALVDLTGGDLPGTQEPVAASSYTAGGIAPRTCGQASKVAASFAKLPSWIPNPRRAEMTVSVGGKVLARSVYSGQGNPVDLPSVFGDVPASSGATKFVSVAAVVDHLGRTLTSSETLAVACQQPPADQ